MRQLFIVLLGCWLLTLSGCAYITSFSSKLPDKIEQLIQQQKYGEALDVLDYVKPGNPDYSFLMKQKERLLVISKKLEQQTLKEARQYLARGKWLKAQKTLESALEKIPDNKPLNTEYDAFIQHRDKHLKNLEIALVQNKAHWLIENTPVKQSIEAILPNAESKYSELKDFHRQVSRISDKLVDCINFSLDEKKWEQANICFVLVKKLDPAALTGEQQKEIQTRLARSHHKYEQAINDKAKKLIIELKQGFSHENLMRAHQHLVLMRSQKKPSRKMRKLQRKLEQKYRERINQGIDAGRELYSNGKIEEALKVWNALLKIDSGNEKLQEHINRANRVLENLERISNSKKAVTPP